MGWSVALPETPKWREIIGKLGGEITRPTNLFPIFMRKFNVTWIASYSNSNCYASALCFVMFVNFSDNIFFFEQSIKDFYWKLFRLDLSAKIFNPWMSKTADMAKNVARLLFQLDFDFLGLAMAVKSTIKLSFSLYVFIWGYFHAQPHFASIVTEKPSTSKRFLLPNIETFHKSWHGSKI